jgi:ribosomal protein L11 methyltransferase
MARGAFGSGEHETTASCLEVLAGHLNLSGCRFLDVGSGTGILAIAAIKLGAAGGVCLDIDPDAVASARENCALNGIATPIRHICGTLDAVPATPAFGLILANIYGDLLLSLAPEMVRRTARGGRLLLSGILWEYNFEVRQAFERLGCQVLYHRMLDEFSTVLLGRD